MRQIGTTVRFNGMREFGDYSKDHPEVFDAVSPGGAAAVLGIGRQRVYDLVKAGKLRAWAVYDSEFDRSDRASVFLVSTPDVMAYMGTARKGGRPKKAA